MSASGTERPRRTAGALAAAAGLLAAVLFAGRAFAHGSERGFVMLLPTDRYLIGGAAAVAATFLLLAVLPARRLDGLSEARLRLGRIPVPDPAPFSLASFAFLAFIVAAGFLGSRDPLENPLPIVIWSLWWTGFTLLQAVTGDLWGFANPWTGPYRLLDRLAGGRLRRAPPLRLPACLGSAPAIVLFLAFAWLQLVSPAPDDPERLALAVIAYWTVTFLGFIAFGEEEWRARGEPFSIFFAAVGRLSPLLVERTSEGGKLFLVWPGSRLVGVEPMPLSRAYLLVAILATVSFDALAQTFAWMAVGEVNPLEFPGRSAMVAQNTAGLAGAMVALPAAYAAAVWLGWRSAARPGPLAASVSLYVPSLVPIAVGLHFAHFFPALMVEAQYGLAVASDPFGTGLDLFGTADRHVTTSFLTTFEGAAFIWNMQTAAVVLGHVLAVIVAHLIAVRAIGEDSRAKLFQVSLAVLMIGYTVLGLWLLSTPVVG